MHGHPDPEKGEIIINKQGEWKHKPLVNGEESQGTTGNTLKAHLSESLDEPLEEAFVVAALKGTPSEAAEAFKKSHVAAGGKIIHHRKTEATSERPEVHEILASAGGKKVVHTFAGVGHDEQYAKYRAVGAKSTHQSRTAGKFDTPKTPNHGNL